jgi:hypothetical protein
MGTKAPAYQLSAITLYIEIFDVAGDLQRVSGHGQYRHKSATARSLAIAAMTIGGKYRLRRTFVPNRTTAATASDGPRHNRLLFLSIIREYPGSVEQSRRSLRNLAQVKTLTKQAGNTSFALTLMSVRGSNRRLAQIGGLAIRLQPFR